MNIDPLQAFTDGLRTEVAQLRHHVLAETVDSDTSRQRKKASDTITPCQGVIA